MEGRDTVGGRRQPNTSDSYYDSFYEYYNDSKQHNQNVNKKEEIGTIKKSQDYRQNESTGSQEQTVTKQENPGTSGESNKKLTISQQKVIRAEKNQVPWKNSDKINLITFYLPSCEVQTVQEETATSSVEIVRVYSVHALPYILGVVEGHPEFLCIDSSSSLNLASAEHYSYKPISPVNGVELTSASGHTIALEGKVTLEIVVGNITIPCEFMLIKGLEMKLLLGNAVFKNYSFKLSYENMSCEFSDKGQNSGPIPLMFHPVLPSHRET
jgi:hypothetical protein